VRVRAMRCRGCQKERYHLGYCECGWLVGEPGPPMFRCRFCAAVMTVDAAQLYPGSGIPFCWGCVRTGRALEGAST
jgi:hypothetical protein